METFKLEFTVQKIHMDCFNRTKPSAMLHFVMRTISGHCGPLGVGWEYIWPMNLTWVVGRSRLVVHRAPVLDEKIVVETWPMPATRSAFPRSTVAYDDQGNELFRLIGLWVLMDRENRTMLLPGKSGIDLPGTLRGNELAPPSSVLPMTLENTTTRKVGYTELDRNGHMNNTRYMNWLDDLLPAAFHREHPVAEFTICYLAEALEGDAIDLNWQLLDGPVLQVDAHRQRTDVAPGKDRVFSARVVF